ncbi:hypothetical protein T492DRAFT_12723 [Pavlovales sp. CCMP2436]|nr:hypothetical protein T492DRAFT_12723 [Pavlovales sp. CCMP2436]
MSASARHAAFRGHAPPTRFEQIPEPKVAGPEERLLGVRGRILARQRAREETRESEEGGATPRRQLGAFALLPSQLPSVLGAQMAESNFPSFLGPASRSPAPAGGSTRRGGR